MSFWGWWFMTAGMVIFAVLVGAAIVYLVRRPVPTQGRSADEILAERYARGEIDHDEFERRRALICQ